RRHTRFSRDWSSDVCSSDLAFDGHSQLPGLGPDALVDLGQRRTAVHFRLPPAQHVEVGAVDHQDARHAPPLPVQSVPTGRCPAYAAASASSLTPATSRAEPIPSSSAKRSVPPTAFLSRSIARRTAV